MQRRADSSGRRGRVDKGRVVRCIAASRRGWCLRIFYSRLDVRTSRGGRRCIRIAPERPGSFPLLRPRLKILLDGDLLLSERLLPSLSTVFSTTRRRPEVEVSRDLSPSSSRPRAWDEVSGIGAMAWAGLTGIDWPIGFPAVWEDGCWGSDIILGRGWLRDEAEGDPIRKAASPVCRVFCNRGHYSYKIPGLAREASPLSSSYTLRLYRIPDFKYPIKPCEASSA